MDFDASLKTAEDDLRLMEKAIDVCEHDLANTQRLNPSPEKLSAIAHEIAHFTATAANLGRQILQAKQTLGILSNTEEQELLQKVERWTVRLQSLKTKKE